jgi:hypothetical protein
MGASASGFKKQLLKQFSGIISFNFNANLSIKSQEIDLVIPKIS